MLTSALNSPPSRKPCREVSMMTRERIKQRLKRWLHTRDEAVPVNLREVILVHRTQGVVLQGVFEVDGLIDNFHADVKVQVTFLELIRVDKCTPSRAADCTVLDRKATGLR